MKRPAILSNDKRTDKGASQGTATPLYQSPLPRWLVNTITIVLIVLLIVILCVGAYWPESFQHSTAKFFVCILLAFCFGISMFVIYPQEARIKNIPLIDLPVELVGPPALFVVSLLLMWNLYPDPTPPSGRFYRLREHGGATRLQIGSIEIKRIAGDCTCYLARDPNDKYIIGGMYAEFKKGNDTCTVTLGNNFANYDVVLDRKALNDVVEVQLGGSSP